MTRANNLDLGNLVASIEADISPLEKSLSKADKLVSGFGGKFLKAAGAATVAVVALGSAITYQMGKSVHAINQTIDSQAKLADSLGTSIELVQGLQFSAPIAGATTQNIEKGLSQIAKLSGEAAEGTDRAKQVLRSLGIEATKFSNMKLQDQFYLIADSLNSVKNSTDRAVLAQKIFGDEVAVKILPLLLSGTTALKQQSEQAARFGLIVSRVDAKTIEAFNDELTITGRRFDGLYTQLSVLITPVFLKLIKDTGKFVDGLGTAKGASESFFFGFASSLGKILEYLETIGISGKIAFKGLEVSAISGAGAIAKSYEFIANGIVGYFNSIDSMIIAQETKIANFFGRVAMEVEQLASVTQNVPFLGSSLDDATKALERFAKSYADSAKAREAGKMSLVSLETQTLFEDAVKVQDEIIELQDRLLELGLTSDKWGNAITQYFKLAQIEAKKASEAALALQENISGKGDGKSVLGDTKNFQTIVDLQIQMRKEAEGIISSYDTQAEKLVILKNRMVELFQAGALTLPEFQETMRRIEKEASRNFMIMKEDIAGAFKSAFQSAAKSGDSFFDSLKSRLADLAVNNLINMAIGGLFGSAGGGTGGGLLGGLFGGFFADGGRPPKNKISVVGEKGREFFIPDVNGTILNQDQMEAAFNTQSEATINSSKDIRENRIQQGQSVQIVQNMSFGEGVNEAAKAAVISAIPLIEKVAVAAIRDEYRRTTGSLL